MMATVVCKGKASSQNFLPLTVDYRQDSFLHLVLDFVLPKIDLELPVKRVKMFCLPIPTHIYL